MGMTVNFHTHTGATARAVQVGNVYWVHLDGEEGRCTVSVFMPSLEHAQAVADAFNAAFEAKHDADQNDVQPAADPVETIRLDGSGH